MKLAWISDSSDKWLCTCTAGQLQSPALSGDWIQSEREGSAGLASGGLGTQTKDTLSKT
jgi:hypothetical protein